MSQYQKSCNYCKQEIRMTNDSGKWKPFNLDGSFHFCSGEQTNTGTKKEETKSNTEVTSVLRQLSLEVLDARLKKVEKIVLDPRK